MIHDLKLILPPNGSQHSWFPEVKIKISLRISITTLQYLHKICENSLVLIKSRRYFDRTGLLLFSVVRFLFNKWHHLTQNYRREFNASLQINLLQSHSLSVFIKRERISIYGEVWGLNPMQCTKSDIECPSLYLFPIYLLENLSQLNSYY